MTQEYPLEEEYLEEDDEDEIYHELMTDEQIEAVLSVDSLIEDYEDQIFFQSLDSDANKDPYGWDITDMMDWDSIDYE